MYKIKYCHSDLELEEFIKEANENNYEIISSAEFKGKLTIIYKIEEKKKTRKSVMKQMQIADNLGEKIKKEEKEGDN